MGHRADPDTGSADPDTGSADPDTGLADPDTGLAGWAQARGRRALVRHGRNGRGVVVPCVQDAI